MNSWKATKVSINLKVKSILGLPHIRSIQRAWKMSEDEFWHYQAETFRSIYAFARQRIPFYRQRPDFYPPLPEGDRGVFELLSGLPVLKKMTVRQHNLEFWAEPPLPLTKYHATSGTTGTPIKLAATLLERSFGQTAYEEWLRRICGKRHPRTLSLSGFMTPSPVDKELFWCDPVFKGIYLSIYSMKQANRSTIVDLIRQEKPELISGYASAVHELALVVGGDLKSTRDTRIAVVTSEVLYPEWRTIIEEQLCNKVYDYYGSQERNHGVMECEAGTHHILPHIGIIELVDDGNRPVSTGEIGKVLVTGLLVRSMPLFRYELGDSAISTGYATNCACGLCWPSIGSVEGRSEDLILTRDGRRIGMLVYSTFKTMKGVLLAQIVQKGYERFVCNIVKNDYEHVENETIENAVIFELSRRLHIPVEVNFNYLPEIPRGSRGKFKAVVVDFDVNGQR